MGSVVIQINPVILQLFFGDTMIEKVFDRSRFRCVEARCRLLRLRRFKTRRAVVPYRLVCRRT